MLYLLCKFKCFMVKRKALTIVRTNRCRGVVFNYDFIVKYNDFFYEIIDISRVEMLVLFLASNRTQTL